MSTTREAGAGTTRTCPHCRTTILDSATVCPACKHHVRFGAGGKLGKPKEADSVPLLVEGTVRHGGGDVAWEYSVVVVVRNQKGQDVSRHVVGVGAIPPGEERTISLAVEVFTRG